LNKRTTDRNKDLEDIMQLEGLEDMISKQVKDEKESKELFKKDDIELRTDINEEETSIIARLKFLCDELELNNFRKALTFLMELRVSKGRKSRKEFIESIKKEQQFLGMNGASNIGGFNGNR